MKIEHLAVLGLLLVLVFAIHPVSALLTKDDFTVLDKTIEPDQDYYIGGEDYVRAIYEVRVKEDVTDELAGEMFKVFTELNIKDIYNNFTVTVNFAEGGANYPTSDKEIKSSGSTTYLQFELPSLDITKFKVEIYGKVPEVSERLKVINVTYFEIGDVSEDALEPLTIKVINKDKFESDLYDYEKKIKELENDLESFKEQGYSTSELEGILSVIKEKYDMARDYYYRDKDYLKCDSYLDDVSNEMEKYYKTKNKLIAEDLNAKISKKIKDLNNLLEDIEMNLTLLYQSKKIDVVVYNRYDRELSDLRETLDEIESQYSDIKKEYYDKEDYEKSVEQFNKLIDAIGDLQKDVEDLNKEIAMYFGSEIENGFNFSEVLSEYWTYMAIGLAGILVVIGGIVIFRRRGRRWDELR
ncbi:hypothetical protein [Archaeoglobus sp.]